MFEKLVVRLQLHAPEKNLDRVRKKCSEKRPSSRGKYLDKAWKKRSANDHHHQENTGLKNVQLFGDLSHIYHFIEEGCLSAASTPPATIVVTIGRVSNTVRGSDATQ